MSDRIQLIIRIYKHHLPKSKSLTTWAFCDMTDWLESQIKEESAIFLVARMGLLNC